ncbi:uncharacterized protein [Notamacropus eugenii]|uniref:uncharacterized protein isoform X2 n=1 Tax=Notamacropus eugenii TaxID=9315 RepID=UPI003B672B2C
MEGSVPYETETQVAGAPEPSMVLPQKSVNLGDLMPTRRSDANKQQSAEKCPAVREAGKADQKLSVILTLGPGDELMPEKQVESIPEPVPRTPLVVPAEVPKVKAAGLARSVAQVAQLVPAMTKPNGAPFSPGAQPQPEAELPSDFLGSPQMPMDSRHGMCLVHRNLVPQSSQTKATSLIHKYSLVPTNISSAWRTSRKLAQEPVACNRIFYYRCVERVLDVKAPRRASSEEEEEMEHARENQQEVAPEGTKGVLHPPNANKIAISTLRAQPESGSQAGGSSERKTDQRDKPKVLSKNDGRKRVYKQAVRELNENGDCMDGEVLTPRTRMPSTICPRSKVRKASPSLHPSVHLKEKEQQWLENLRKEEEELLRKQKMEKDKLPHLEEVKHVHLEEMKRNLEEFFQKVGQAQEWAEQLEIEEKNHPEQYLAQLEKDPVQLEKDPAQLVQNLDQLVQDPTQLEKNEEVKDGWQTEKAGKKVSKKLEEAETWRQMQEAKIWRQMQESEVWRRKQEAEAWRRMQESEAWRQMQEAEARMRMQESEVWKWKQEAEAWRQMQEAEVWRRMQEAENQKRMQEVEVWRLKRLQQEKEEGRYQEQLQNEEKEQELLQQKDEAPGIWEQQLVLDWFQAEWDQQEKARLLKEQQEKKEKEECQHQEQEKQKLQEEAMDTAAAAWHEEM